MRASFVALVAALLLLVVPGSAGAYSFVPGRTADDPTVKNGFTGAVYRDGAQNSGNYADNAGEHPDTGVIKFGFETDSTVQPDDGNGDPDVPTKSVHVEIPPGLAPNPTAFPTCTNAQFAVNACPRGAQVGTIEARIRGNVGILLGLRETIDVILPVYNMALESPTQLARFAFDTGSPASGAPLAGLLIPNGDGPVDLGRVDINGGIRDTSDYGLFFDIKTPVNPLITKAKLTFWGQPGSTRFDNTKDPGTGSIPGRNIRCTELVAPVSIPIPGFDNICAPAGAAGTPIDRQKPFLTNPTACLGILNTRIAATGVNNQLINEDFDTPRGAQNCPSVPFAPQATFKTTAPTRDKPTGFDIGIKVPQSTDGTTGTSHVKRLAATLPRGVTLNPSVGNTIQVCADSQFPTGAAVHSPIGCPAASRVGSASVKSPLIPDPITGALYAGQPLPGDRYRLFADLTVRGVVVRLKGSAQADPNTGQLTAVFDDLPQLPFDSLDLSIDGGPNSILAAPQDCSPANGLVSFGPWSGNPASQVPGSVQATGCSEPAFKPAFSAKPGSTRSGAYGTAAVNVARPDGQQFLSRVRVDLPPGQLADIKSQAQCPASAAATGACAANTRVGTARVSAGAGDNPLSLSGPVYFAGPYKGAPYSFVTVIRAVAGPYDLGNVVVRQAVGLDPKDAHVVVSSDPLPQVVGGIPLRLRNLTFDVNKAKFVINPSYCGSRPARALLGSAGGLNSNGANLFSFAGCKSLKFKPRLGLTLRGKGAALRDGGHPSLVAQLRGSGRHGQANFRRVVVSLPTSLALDPTNAKTLCEYAEAIKPNPKCPKGSVVGFAKAKTPILGKALASKVYFAKRVRTNQFGRQVTTLPMLVLPLRGNGVAINLLGTTAVSGNRLVTTFTTPDAPVSAFDLRIDGGRNGILVANRNVCRGSRAARVAMRGQNGVVRKSSPAIGAKGC